MISHEPPPGAVAPLPLLPTIVEGWRLLAGNLATLAKITALPFVLQLLLEAVTARADRLTAGLLWDFGIEIPWTLMAVAWLRLLLLPAQGSKPPFFPRPQRRHLRFLFYALLLSFVSLPLTLFAELADALALEEDSRPFVYWALFLVVFYLGLRFAFVYAATAVDESYSLALAWRHTRGCSFNLLLAVGIAAYLPWEAFNALAGHLLAQSDQPAVQLFVALAWYAGFWLLEAIYLAFVVVAFRRVTGWVPPPDNAILERFE